MSKAGKKFHDKEELRELSQVLAAMDFSKDSDKAAVFQRVRKNAIMQKGDFIMKKSNKFRRIVAVAASFAIVCTLSFTVMQTTFAQDLIAKVKSAIPLGHATAFQMEPSKSDTWPLPDELKGKIFDKDGKPVEVLSRNKKEDIFTKYGEKIVDISNNQIVTEFQKKQEEQDQKLNVTNPDELSKYTCFKVVLPGYLPEGCKFEHAKLFSDDKGEISDKYIDLYFTNPETKNGILMQQRFASKETGYEKGTDGTIEKIKINGADAVIFDNSSIDWEANNVLYSIQVRGEVSKSELIKIAESIK